MRRQERNWPANKKETAKEHATRLRRTAMGIRGPTLAKLVASMKRRCVALEKAKGGHFEE